jgi:hypothetical protein
VVQKKKLSRSPFWVTMTFFFAVVGVVDRVPPIKGGTLSTTPTRRLRLNKPFWVPLFFLYHHKQTAEAEGLMCGFWNTSPISALSVAAKNTAARFTQQGLLNPVVFAAGF